MNGWGKSDEHVGWDALVVSPFHVLLYVHLVTVVGVVVVVFMVKPPSHLNSHVVPKILGPDVHVSGSTRPLAIGASGGHMTGSQMASSPLQTELPMHFLRIIPDGR